MQRAQSVQFRGVCVRRVRQPVLVPQGRGQRPEARLPALLGHQEPGTLGYHLHGVAAPSAADVVPARVPPHLHPAAVGLLLPPLPLGRHGRAARAQLPRPRLPLPLLRAVRSLPRQAADVETQGDRATDRAVFHRAGAQQSGIPAPRVLCVRHRLRAEHGRTLQQLLLQGLPAETACQSQQEDKLIGHCHGRDEPLICWRGVYRHVCTSVLQKAKLSTLNVSFQSVFGNHNMIEDLLQSSSVLVEIILNQS